MLLEKFDKLLKVLLITFYVSIFIYSMRETFFMYPIFLIRGLLLFFSVIIIAVTPIRSYLLYFSLAQFRLVYVILFIGLLFFLRVKYPSMTIALLNGSCIFGLIKLLYQFVDLYIQFVMSGVQLSILKEVPLNPVIPASRELLTNLSEVITRVDKIENPVSVKDQLTMTRRWRTVVQQSPHLSMWRYATLENTKIPLSSNALEEARSFILHTVKKMLHNFDPKFNVFFERGTVENLMLKRHLMEKHIPLTRRNNFYSLDLVKGLVSSNLDFLKLNKFSTLLKDSGQPLNEGNFYQIFLRKQALETGLVTITDKLGVGFNSIVEAANRPQFYFGDLLVSFNGSVYEAIMKLAVEVKNPQTHYGQEFLEMPPHGLIVDEFVSKVINCGERISEQYQVALSKKLIDKSVSCLGSVELPFILTPQQERFFEIEWLTHYNKKLLKLDIAFVDIRVIGAVRKK